MAGRVKDPRKAILAALSSRGAALPCPRCGGGDFRVLDDGLEPRGGSGGKGERRADPAGPAALLACDRCGFLARHSLSILGVGPDPKESSALTVLSAVYGANGKFLDLTDTLAKAAVLRSVDVVVGNHLGGDPCEGVEKDLVVVYVHKGRRHIRSAREGTTLSLP